MSDSIELLNAWADKTFGKGVVFDLKHTTMPDIEKVSCGSLKIDLALGGGVPKGRLIEIYGPESSGKTSVSLHLITQAQRDPAYREEGRRALFVDVEHALDLTYAKRLGVDLDNLILAQPDSGEAALQIVEHYLKSGEISVCVLDSVPGLTTKRELAGEIGDDHMAEIPRLLSTALKKLVPAAHNANSILVFINQIRSSLSPYGPSEVVPGGKAIKFYASQRLEIKRQVGKATLDSEGDVLRIPTTVKVIKNKMAPPFRSAVVDVERNIGINKYCEILDLGVDLGLISKNGHHYEVVDPRRTAFLQDVVDKNPQTLDELKACVHFDEIVIPESVEIKRSVSAAVKNFQYNDLTWKAAGRDAAIKSLRAKANRELANKLEKEIRAKLVYTDPLDEDEE